MGTPPRIKLDYQSVSDRKELLGSLSAITEANGFLWTASDEGHTLECLRPDGANRYCLKESYSLKHIFSGLQQEAGKAKPPEADIESLSVSDNKWLWICGSHCKVPTEDCRRLAARLADHVRIEPVPARPGQDHGGDIEQTGDHLPLNGPGSLRDLMMRNGHVQPFLGIPSKENGLDIEGITVTESGAAFLG